MTAIPAPPMNVTLLTGALTLSPVVKIMPIAMTTIHAQAICATMELAPGLPLMVLRAMTAISAHQTMSAPMTFARVL